MRRGFQRTTSSYSSLNFLRAGCGVLTMNTSAHLTRLLDDLLSAGRFQIERDAALVAVGEMPLVSVICQRLRWDLVRKSPGVAVRRLHFDDVSAEIGQDHGGAGSCNEACEVHDFESEKN